MTDIGPDLEVVDEPQAVADPMQVDTCFLLHNVTGLTAPTVVTSASQAREAWSSQTGTLALTDAWFGEGGGRLVLVPLAAMRSGGADAEDLDAIGDALALIGPELGPGQLVAPAVTDPIGHAAIGAWGWEENRVFIANGEDGEDDETLELIAETLRRSTGARYIRLDADTLVIPGIASGSTREVPSSIVVAALHARNDIAGAHPNNSAAGVNGACRYVIGIKRERTRAERNALAAAGVNVFRTYATSIRNYGVRTVVDREAMRQWTQFPGSRTIMAVRARELAVAEQFNFEQVDGEGRLLDRYAGALRRYLAELTRRGALFNTPTSPAYRVDVSATVNPLNRLALGEVTADITVKVSPTVEAPKIKIVRRPITQEV